MKIQPCSTLLLLAVSLALVACNRLGDAGLPGYAEGEYVHVAAPAAGQITRLTLKRGDQTLD